MEFQIKEVIEAIALDVISEEDGNKVLDALIGIEKDLVRIKVKLNAKRRSEMDAKMKLPMDRNSIGAQSAMVENKY